MAQAVRAVGAEALTRHDDTIFALSTGRPPAAIAIVRISGRDAFMAAEALMRTLPPPRQPALRRLRGIDDGELDRALVLCFEADGSSTGEDVVELHLHGGRAVVEAVEGALLARGGVRRAEAGEFTRRAFHNGRIDLIEAEGLADLLAAETESQRLLAIEAVEGRVSRLVEEWRERVLMLSARAEAMIDFDEEGDVAPDETIGAEVSDLTRELKAWLAQPAVERLRDATTVVLAGPVNAGKSSLFNALVLREAAIVSETPGTTRDRVEAEIMRDGRAFRLVDTAGWREASDDPIEREGILRSRRAADAADVVLWLGDDSPQPSWNERAVHVHARNDLADRYRPPDSADVSISVIADVGLNELWAILTDRADRPRASTLAFNQRQRDLIGQLVDALVSTPDDPVLLAANLQLAREIIDRLLGKSGVNDMLNSLFGRFCVGK